jgi:hypothetical protein
MISVTTYKTQDGLDVELREFANSPPMVSINGVIQQPGTYHIVGKSVFFDDLSKNKWEPWFAWRPVRINGKWYWLAHVYRKFLVSPGGGFYRYGDDFDMLRNI